MYEHQLPENNRISFEAFLKRKAAVEREEGLSIGDTREDWEPWWLWFLAGWKAKGDLP